MSSLYLAFSVVFPLFCMMALGYFLKGIKLFNELFLKQLNSVCFKVFLPMVLFYNVYNSDFKNAFSPQLVGLALVCVLVSFAILMVLVPILIRQNNRRSVVIQGIFRSNFILFGLPVVASFYGGENTSVVAILIAFVIPVYNILSVVVLEIYSKEKTNFKAIAKGIATNPLVVAAIIGFCFVLSGIRLPIIVMSTLSDVARVATPLALIVLGGSFSFANLHKSAMILSLSALGKLIILPAIFLPICIALGFRNVELVALMAMLASPTAVSTYTMAQSANADYELAGQIVVVNSVLSVISIFLWITVLKTLQLI